MTLEQHSVSADSGDDRWLPALPRNLPIVHVGSKSSRPKHKTVLRNNEGSGALVAAGVRPDWSKMMGDPRQYEGGNSDDEEILLEDGEDDLDERDENGERLGHHAPSTTGICTRQQRY